jgi:hypothetical protein
VASLGAVVLVVGVGDQAQVGDQAAESGWVQPPGRLHQHRFGLGGGVGGQILGAGGQHRGVDWGELAGGQRLGGRGQGAAEQGPGGPDPAAGGGGAGVEAAAEPAGGGAELDALVGAGGAVGVDPGQLSEPVAFQAVQ